MIVETWQAKIQELAEHVPKGHIPRSMTVQFRGELTRKVCVLVCSYCGLQYMLHKQLNFTQKIYMIGFNNNQGLKTKVYNIAWKRHSFYFLLTRKIWTWYSKWSKCETWHACTVLVSIFLLQDVKILYCWISLCVSRTGTMDELSLPLKCFQVSSGDAIELSGIFLPIPYFGFRALRAGLIADTYLEVMSVTQFKKQYEQ